MLNHEARGRVGREGPRFWNQDLPRAIEGLLGHRRQAIEPFERDTVAGPLSMGRLRRAMARMVEDYRPDLQGRQMVVGVRQVRGKLMGIVEPLSVDSLAVTAARADSVEEIARFVVTVASCYSPDYGHVGHPCHPWCPRWGACPDLQQPAIQSLLLHLNRTYLEEEGR